MNRPEPKSLLVLGCGSSLANYPFDKYNIDTIGMNQAYRYWNYINWYPTYYACLDKNVNTNFAKDIKLLIKNQHINGIKKFFLSKNILEVYPKIKKYSNVLFVEDLNNSSNFGFSGEILITTGSFAARFGLFLGYTKIYLLGIDAHYKPIDKKWIKSVCDSNQRLIKTINPEPDYFFVGYRQKGDYLHIPPKRRMIVRTNHLETFIKINNEFNKQNTMVFVSSKESMLYTNNILPFQAIPDYLLPLHITIPNNTILFIKTPKLKKTIKHTIFNQVKIKRKFNLQ